MPDATIAWLCIDMTYNSEAVYNTVQQKFKSQVVFIVKVQL